MISLVPAFLSPLLIGFALVSLLWRSDHVTADSIIVRLGISAGLGFGLTSALFFLWILFASSFVGGFLLVETALVLTLGAALFLTRRKGVPPLHPRTDGSVGRSSVRWLFALSFLGIVALSLAGFSYLSLNRPHGGWDAWALWNMRARFLFRGGEHWRGVLSVIPDLHPDYPFLVPGVVARAWSYVGKDLVSVPALASLGFTLATVLLLCASLNLVRGGSQGYVAGIALLGASEFVRQGASQYADVYLGFFFLASLVLVFLASERETGNAGLAILAGTAAALAAWTKNEGIPFLLLFLAAGALVPTIFVGANAGLRRLAYLVAGALPVALLVLQFKVGLAPPTDFLAERKAGVLLPRLLDPSRYVTIAKAFLGHAIWKFHLPLWIVYLGLLGIDRERGKGQGFLVAGATVLAMFGIYFAVYVTTSKPLQWQLDTSLNRILVQLWPSFLFLVFLCARTPESFVVSAKPVANRKGPAEVRRSRREMRSRRGKG